MSRERVVDGAVASLLALLAVLVALPFRAEALLRTRLVSLGWDAALHATEGLDLFDDLRLGRPLDALFLLVGRHWWGPAWALVSAPFQAAFGPSLAAASLPSLAAFVLAPAVGFLLARRLAPAGGPVSGVLTGIVVAGLFLRSPMLLETSAWPMLESFGGLLALAAFLFFARREEPAARRAAFLAGALLFLLKYHFGFFVLATFLAVVLAEETPDARRRLGRAGRALLLRGTGAGILVLAAALATLRVFLEARGGDALARRAPSVSNVAWGTFVLLVSLGAVRRRSLAEAWNEASSVLRDFVLFGVLPCAAWCLDPVNVRGWYRQVFQPTDAPERNPLAKLAAFWGFLREDYTIGAGAAGLVALGLVLALVLPGDRTRRALAAFAIWPVVLMSLSAYPAEARFFACLAPGLFAAAVAGLAAGASRPGRRWREAALAAAAAILALDQSEARWRATTEARAVYRFSYGAVETAAIEAAVAGAPAGGHIRIRLPADPPIWPTVRLALRLSRRDLAPVDVDVQADP
ncbi:MAG: hypothetical protein NEA02_09735 [Thermoanaerobaculia bacterium]|nr:hypothetical protein [Thermoanaerobaculia bacterium]